MLKVSHAEHIETAPWTEYLNGLKYAQRLPGKEKMAVFWGHAGTGKTEGAVHFCREHEGCYYVKCPPRRWMKASTYSLWERIGNAVGLADTRRSSRAYYEAIAEVSRKRVLLICIDNANSICKYEIIEEIKELHDDLTARVRFALIGTHRLLDFFTRDENDEFSTRAPWKREVRFLTKEEIGEAFPGLKQATANRLEEVTRGRMRHLLAHMNPLDAGEIEIEKERLTRKTYLPSHVDAVEQEYVQMANTQRG